MNRFILFSGLNYESCGGWDDFDSHHHTFDDAEKEAIKTGPRKRPVNGWDWAHIVDLETGEVVSVDE